MRQFIQYFSTNHTFKVGAMRRHRVVALCMAVALSLSLAVGQTKDDCSAKSTTASKSDCCLHATKASVSSDAKSSNNGTIVLVKNTKDVAKTASNCTASTTAKECTDADKAKCDMAKTSMTNAKLDCCKNKAKTSEAKNTTKKANREKVAEAKGTN